MFRLSIYTPVIDFAVLITGVYIESENDLSVYIFTLKWLEIISIAMLITGVYIGRRCSKIIIKSPSEKNLGLFFWGCHYICITEIVQCIQNTLKLLAS